MQKLKLLILELLERLVVQLLVAGFKELLIGVDLSDLHHVEDVVMLNIIKDIFLYEWY